MPSPVIVHYHIFKNAGTSVDFALKECFGTRWTTFEGKHSHDILNRDALRAFLDAQPEINAVSSHLCRPPLPYENSLPILFLRHPILRAKSVYEFVRNDNTQPDHELASQQSFRDYVKCSLFEDTGGVVIKNYQVIHLSDASFREEHILKASAQLADLEQAKNLLFSWPAFGIVEFYEKSMALFNTRYSNYVPGLKLPVAWLNTTSQIDVRYTRTIESRVDSIRVELGNDIFEALCSSNIYDLDLYYSCVEKFKENVAISLDLN